MKLQIAVQRKKREEEGQARVLACRIQKREEKVVEQWKLAGEEEGKKRNKKKGGCSGVRVVVLAVVVG